MGIGENYRDILDRVSAAAERSGRRPEDVMLLAVTKRHTVAEIQEAVDAGAVNCGENKVQELLEKYDDLQNVNWHLIGHLQTNKVKNIIDKVVMIHSVDSLKLAKEIDRRAAAAGLKMDVLLQINSAMEETKTGIPAEELEELTRAIAAECKNIRIKGIMCIPPMAENPEDARPYFRQARDLFEEMKSWGLPEEAVKPTVLSMGMSGDFEVAIEEGSTIVRVGSSIFGRRSYR